MGAFLDYVVKPETKVQAAKITRVFGSGQGVAWVKLKGRAETVEVNASVRPRVGDFLIDEPRGKIVGYVCPRAVFQNKYQQKG